MDRFENDAIENGNLDLTGPAHEGLSQESLLEIALRHRWSILTTVILFLIGAFLYILKATPIYTSTTRLYVEQSGPKIINEYEGLMTGSKNYLYTQAELIKSTPIIAEVADDAQIRRFRSFANVDNLVIYLKKGLDVAVGKKNDIITVSLDSPYPDEAAQLVNAVVESYIRYHSTRKRSTVSEVLGILQKEKVKRDKELSDKFAQMLEFTRANGGFSFDNSGGHIAFQRLAKLSEALFQAQHTTINAKADYEAILSMSDEPAKIKQYAAASPTAGVRIFLNDEETALRSEIRNLEIRLRSTKKHCTEEHPTVQELRAKIEQLNQELNREAEAFARAYIDVMQQRWATAKQRENELLVSYEAQQRAAQDLGVKAAEYAVLQSELSRTERLCEILDDRIKELNITEDVGALNINILEVARPADGPSKPQKARLMATALAFGFMAGFGLALLREWLDYRLRSAEEISAVLSIPVLGIVPTMAEEHVIAGGGWRMWSGFKSMAGQTIRTICGPIFSSTSWVKARRIVMGSQVGGDGKAVLKKQAVVARGQKVHLESRSIVAEAYRTIRTAIFFGVPKDRAKTILVTSPAPGDGKSTLVSNLAIAMAQAGQKTLVLDCDFRRSVQQDIFEIDNEQGLCSVLAGEATLDEATEPGPVEGLDVLPRGPEVPNPSEILNSDAFVEMLKELSERYDRVIIDSPPVGPVADSQILSAVCDIVLLVLRAEKSTRKHSRQARDVLLSVGAHLLGAVVNDVPRKHGRYDGYGYGGYGHYGYGRKKEQKEYLLRVNQV